MFIVVVCLFFIFRFSFSFLLFFFCLLLYQAIFRWLASILRFFVFKKSNLQYLKKKIQVQITWKKIHVQIIVLNKKVERDHHETLFNFIASFL